ncbi:Acetate--CoA ligase [ADP-forming] [Candidatus Bilamarchaeum dharawalense]|uniref:Acetate--CoA ligase [ADP-forming] n=1 Tax=Candidatus Bilamarchaeum dharawalense TaxID=2885759 RepID=A0A5E4LQT7_9ARCH|nr:Acetate--CoA ligase [ADP-forming] [Candidatus Bilamarchaeum dharawalense]
MDDIKKIIETSKTIAIVGLSDKPDRPSHVVASYLVANGFKIYPVNPNLTDWHGLKAYKSLSEIKEKIDIVDIFRKSEDVLPIVEEATKRVPKPKTIWMQLGVVNETAAEVAKKAGLNVVMDKCIKIEHTRLKES